MDETFGQALRRLRGARSLRAVAQLAHCSKSYVFDLETGRKEPTLEIAAALDRALNAAGALLALVHALYKEEATYRREATALFGKALMAATQLDRGRRVVQALDVMGSQRPSVVADSVSELIGHYSVTICAIPPAEVYDELIVVREYANRVLDRLRSVPQHKDLTLSTGWLSCLLAIAACDMGAHAAAHLWCGDAERRSAEARHPELAGWAALTKSMIAFYQGQSRQSLTLAAQGRSATPIGTAVHAKLAAQEMRAAAMAGDVDRTENASRYAAQSMAKLPSHVKVTGAFSIPMSEDPPYTATSLMLLGRHREAVAATNRVIRNVYQPEARQRGEHPSGYARSLLILGLAQAGAGDLDEAVSAGHAALVGNRPAWPTTVLAGKLNQILHRDFPNAVQTSEYNVRYLEVTNHHTGQPPQLSPRPQDRK
jgi:transcriptional regulator with XRE-family HTH domain